MAAIKSNLLRSPCHTQPLPYTPLHSPAPPTLPPRPTAGRGHWNTEEHRRFLAALGKVGTNWRKIAQVVSGSLDDYLSNEPPLEGLLCHLGASYPLSPSSATLPPPALTPQVETRTPIQVRTHAQKYFLKLRKVVRRCCKVCKHACTTILRAYFPPSLLLSRLLPLSLLSPLPCRRMPSCW